ncbi:MAG: hypothetical protein LUQ26_07785, partial [Methylococcaceae bacterium]|nr:hypothetical protein [Methylococcaceae bacterium]
VTASLYFGISDRPLFIIYLFLFAGFYWAINKRVSDRRKMTIPIEGPDRRKLPDRRSKSKKGNIPTHRELI